MSINTDSCSSKDRLTGGLMNGRVAGKVSKCGTAGMLHRTFVTIVI